MKLIPLLLITLYMCLPCIAQDDLDFEFYDALEKAEAKSVSYTHLRAHETREDLVCRLLLENK